MTEKSLLSLVLLMKDEARSVAKVIECAAPAVDRVDLLDTGSTDGTIELARATCERLGLPIAVYQEPFVDFATSRNRSLELAEPHAVFGVQISGDEYMSNPEALRGFCEEKRDAAGYGENAYHVDMHYDAQWNDSQRLVRLGTGWKWIGVVHEYMVREGDRTTQRVPGTFVLHTGSDPVRKRMRFYKDFELLREEHLRNPKHPRTVFYLAQTLECLGMLASAAALYHQCAGLSGWDEEVFVAKYRAAYFAERSLRPWHEVEAMYLDAYATRPWRNEPLIAIAEHYHGEKKYAQAYLFASRAASIPYPKGDVLFIDSHAYAWKGLNLVGICAYYAHAYEEGAAATHRMIELRPQDENLRKNLAFYEAKLAPGRTTDPLPPPPPPEERVAVGGVELRLHPNTFDVWIRDEVLVDDAYGLRTMDLPPRPTILDVGAHVGIFAASALAQRPGARVVCCEMDAENFARLEGHLGGRANVSLVHGAVVGAKMPAGYAHVPANTGAHALVYSAREGLRPIGTTMSLGSLMETHGIERVDLLKLDVEGAEFEILREAARWGSLERVRRIVGEWHEAFGDKHEELGTILAPWFDVRFTRINDNSGMFFADAR